MEKKCKDCIHYRNRWWLWFFGLEYMFREVCARKTNRSSYFDYGLSHCDIERNSHFANNNICGKEGKYFEPKKPVQDQYELNYKKPVSYL